MAHLNGLMDNSRGRNVSVSEPTFAYIRGWRSGVRVEARQDENGEDFFVVFMTAGSGADHKSYLLGTVRSTGSGPQWRQSSGIPQEVLLHEEDDYGLLCYFHCP